MATNISKLTIQATLQKVWDTVTKAELVKRWQYGSELQTTWEIGSPIKFVTEWEGQIYQQWGTVLDVQQNKLVKYSLFAPGPGVEDKPENYFTMSYVLTDDNGITTLEIVQEDNRPNAVQEPEQGAENPVLLSLKDIAEAS